MRTERPEPDLRAHREIILSTGGFNTPKLLMLSGIGDEAQLRAFGIPVHVHSANVGENVQDHALQRDTYASDTTAKEFPAPPNTWALCRRPGHAEQPRHGAAPVR